MTIPLTSEQRGLVWVAIRSELSNQWDSLTKAVKCEKYEMASGYLDGVARKLTEAVANRLMEPS